MIPDLYAIFLSPGVRRRIIRAVADQLRHELKDPGGMNESQRYAAENLLEWAEERYTAMTMGHV